LKRNLSKNQLGCQILVPRLFGLSASAVTKVIVPGTRVLNVIQQRQFQITGSGCLFFIQWNH